MIRLQTWLSKTFGDDAVTMYTARKWAREGKFTPSPKKVGRTWYVEANAEYTDKPTHSLLRRIHADETERRAV